jgi:hypothetical protein
MAEALLGLVLAGLLTWEDIEQAEAILNDPNATAENKKKAEEQLDRIQRRHDAEEEASNSPLTNDVNDVSDPLSVLRVNTYSCRLIGKMGLKKWS